MNAIDTNILIYAIDAAQPAKQAKAKQVLAALGEGVLLWQVACEYLSASRKYLKPHEDPSVIGTRLADVQLRFPLVLPKASNLIRAQALMRSHRLQPWDALIYAGCLEAGIARLYSEDLPGQAIAGLEVINPFAE